jgi:hypothetical protein
MSRFKRFRRRITSAWRTGTTATVARLDVIITAGALIGGWLLVTYGLTAFVRPRVVWPMSIGALLVSIGGWHQLGRTAWYGLYTLTRD